MRTTPTDEIKNSIVKEYLAGGTTYRKLQEKYGYDFRVIHSWVKKSAKYHTAPKLFKRWKAYEDVKLKSLVKQGYSSEDIAITLGRTRGAVCARKYQLGIENRFSSARRSKLPYTAFNKNFTDNETLSKESAPEVKSLGQYIDSVIFKAKQMGLKVNISVSSQE